MSWTRPADLHAQLQKLWDRGALLRGLVTDSTPFPLRLLLRGPGPAEMTYHFDAVRAWIVELRAMPHYRVEMREIKHRVFGVNTIPGEIWIDTLTDALTLVGKQQQAAVFTTLVELTRQHQPSLLGWLEKNPLRALELAGEWQRLLNIVYWLQAHPRPTVYLRQMDIPGVHSKFVEVHRGVLGELLDLALPPEQIDISVAGISQFARRYGFLEKPERIRWRILDPRHALLPNSPQADITLDANSFARLDPKVARVFITENEINFLAFPPVMDSLLIFGAGYGFDMLSQAGWLARCHIYYWGDIDTHGFAILDQLRNRLAHVESFLMDRATLLEFAMHWAKEDRQTLRDLPRLTEKEKALYDDLRDNRIRHNLRLEQERIGFSWVQTALAALDTKK